MAPQDSFIEEEEDVCPLCIEEFDLSDRNFRPCPCGYQVCQFCFNNIKNNMNGLCPACRRPYDEKTIEWKVVTQEEVAEFRANIQKNQKKRAQEQRHKEVQKREAEKENRKNLIGPEFFGQYGNIQKISISNRKSPDGQHHSLGIYVTFEKPEEATKCIQAVHGSQNGDRVLKAQHGTTKAGNDDDASRPMFDVRGGEKRKAMREDEESRIDQEDSADIHAASEGEPETGGSMALGGEPEDREHVGDGLGFDQRPSATQPPVQRGGTEALYGANTGGSGFSLNSVGIGRSLTPQQLAAFRSQTGLGDQLLSAPSMFQSPGHNRQSSRFSFGNENGNSTTNVKLAANPRIMAQQSSMMPSSFQSQTGNQFYGNSIPGPPPGLKSSNASPSMFGQGFGAGSTFGNVAKDSSSDLLQALIGRNRGGTSQPSDAGKLDLADPSILQARMQLQSQSNAGVAGQGLFGGGQSQENDLLPLDDAAFSVDALVSDESPGVFSSPGYALEAGTACPVPPGFAIPPTIANSLASSPISSLASPVASQYRHTHIVPALPKAPLPPGLDQGTFTPQPTPRKSAALKSEARRNRMSAPDAESSDNVAPAPATGEQGSSALQDEDFPALGSSRPSKGQSGSPHAPIITTPKPTPAAKRGADRVLDKPSDTQRHPPPTASVDASSKNSVTLGTQGMNKVTMPEDAHIRNKSEKPVESSSTFPPLPPPSIASPSPMQRNTPRTLRVMSIPKNADMSASSSPVQSVASKAISIFHRPDTPMSEMVSDTASMVSASISASRAGSPPPNKVGSAAVRNTTKSQQRKQRKEAFKQDTKTMAEITKSEPEEHAPVIGRKKKQKKEKEKTAASVASHPETASSTAEELKTQPTSSQPDQGKAKGPYEERSRTRTMQQKKMSKSKVKEKEREREREREREKEKEKGKEKATPTSAAAATSYPAVSAQAVPVEPIESADPAERQQFGPASVFAEIRNSLWTSAVEKLQILKPVSSSSSRPDHQHAANSATQSGYCKDCACKCGEIQDEDLAALRAGKPVRKQFHVDGSRMLITPNGDCIRGLTSEEEDDFLNLQAAIAATAENPGSFVAPRHQPGSGAFSLIKGRAVPNGRPNIFPTSAQPQAQDPIGKLQQEDALSYINQYVLPRLNLDAANMGFPKGASPLRDAAAASLNALAPYFYGPDAAAGVGIYSAPDGARAMQDFSPGGGAPAADVSKIGPTNGLGGISLMSVEDAEVRLAAARKETDKLEKGLNAVIKRNRRLLLGSST
ncbi:uncharacterized protein UV8b_00665 [Ustilaginoidea virens]|uniref:RING-type domain-containing protein n=1 Tax=Ustilaginoidea virens TaxID=1159556 RepID=A0A8E5HK48_USTVR|nr:uncharacterized protein UV8b_00665 [Ustilaginoidea virens]QUC16424.1 hypothetical protein UV8b_00665 [Ustilaginoidea virens]